MMDNKKLKQLKADIKRLGKTANQRIVELEKQGIEESSWAYRKYVKNSPDVTMSSSGHTKYDLRVKGVSEEILKQRLYQIKKFLSAPSSSAMRTNKAIDSRDNTFIDYGTTTDEAIDLFELVQKYNANTFISSDSVVVLSSRITKEEFEKELKKGNYELYKIIKQINQDRKETTRKDEWSKPISYKDVMSSIMNLETKINKKKRNSFITPWGGW